MTFVAFPRGTCSHRCMGIVLFRSRRGRYAFIGITGILVLGAASLWILPHYLREREFDRLAETFRASDPIADAQRAIVEGDFRFKATYGLGLVIPGVQGPRSADYFGDTYGVNPIKGTSDNIVGNAQMRFENAVCAYASAYNAELIRHLQGNIGLETQSRRDVIRASGGQAAVISGRIIHVVVPLACTQNPAAIEVLKQCRDAQAIIFIAYGADDAALSGLSRVPVSFTLDLWESKVTDKGLAFLKGVKGLKEIHSLHTYTSNVSARGIEDFKDARPDVAIAQ